MNNKNKLEKNILIFILANFLVITIILIFFLKKDYIVKESKKYKIGIISYSAEDTYISTILSALENEFKKYELENDVFLRTDISYSRESQSVQNSQVEHYLSLNYDLLIINMVNRTEASGVIDKAMAKNIPIIFFNREPVEEDMKKWDKIFYVGFDAKKTAKLQSEIILEKYKEDPLSIDLNNDGVIQYIMLEGESRHQDSLIRTEKCIEYLKAGNLKLERLEGGIANWSRTQANVLMEEFLNEYGEKIELVICNNDDMALGVVDLMESKNLNFSNIVGIDGTPPGIEAVLKNKMLGTVKISAEKCANKITEMSLSLLENNKLNDNIELEDNIYVWVEQNIKTSKN